MVQGSAVWSPVSSTDTSQKIQFAFASVDYVVNMFCPIEFVVKDDSKEFGWLLEVDVDFVDIEFCVGIDFICEKNYSSFGLRDFETPFLTPGIDVIQILVDFPSDEIYISVWFPDCDIVFILRYVNSI